MLANRLRIDLSEVWMSAVSKQSSDEVGLMHSGEFRPQHPLEAPERKGVVPGDVIVETGSGGTTEEVARLRSLAYGPMRPLVDDDDGGQAVGGETVQSVDD